VKRSHILPCITLVIHLYGVFSVVLHAHLLVVMVISVHMQMSFKKNNDILSVAQLFQLMLLRLGMHCLTVS